MATPGTLGGCRFNCYAHTRLMPAFRSEKIQIFPDLLAGIYGIKNADACSTDRCPSRDFKLSVFVFESLWANAIFPCSYSSFSRACGDVVRSRAAYTKSLFKNGHGSRSEHTNRSKSHLAKAQNNTLAIDITSMRLGRVALSPVQVQSTTWPFLLTNIRLPCKFTS